MTATDAEGFALLFERYCGRVLAYARRHSDPNAAEDVTSDTFLVAWRRRADLPPDPLPWLLVVARNTLANRRRAVVRAQRLQTELSAVHQLAAHTPAAESAVIDRAAMLHALASLSALEREAVLLVAWDGLAIPDAAQVAGCATRAFHVRLHRARMRLARVMDLHDCEPADSDLPAPDAPPPTYPTPAGSLPRR